MGCALIQYYWCSYKRKRFGHGHAQRTHVPKRDHSDASTNQGMPKKKKKKRNAKTPSKPSEPRREAWNRFSLVALGRNRLCQQPWTSSLQNCETVKFLMFKPFGLWCFVMAAFSSVQSLSHVQHTATPWTAACQVTCPPLSLRVYSNSCLLSQ